MFAEYFFSEKGNYIKSPLREQKKQERVVLKANAIDANFQETYEKRDKKVFLLQFQKVFCAHFKEKPLQNQELYLYSERDLFSCTFTNEV